MDFIFRSHLITRYLLNLSKTFKRSRPGNDTPNSTNIYYFDKIDDKIKTRLLPIFHTICI